MANTKLPARLLDTSAVPALNVTGDLTVNTTTLKVDSTNDRVGIGIASPGRTLHIKDSGQIKLESTSSGGWVGLDFAAGNGTYDGYMGMLDSNGRFFIDVDSNGEDLTILQNGNVGIGTSSPSSYYAKNLVVMADGDGTGGITIAAPATDDNTYLAFADGTSGAATYAGYVGYSHSSEYLFFGAGASTRMYIKGSNVGIGTNDPGAGLEVLKSGGGKIRISETASRYVEIIGYAEGTANGSTMAFHTVETGTSTSTERMRINYSGKVGIGTNNPLGSLSVGAGSINDPGLPVQISTGADGTQAWYAVNRNGGYGALFGYSASSTYKGLALRNVVAAGTSNADGISFITNNTSMRMHIKGDGNVGIGTSNPADRLHVALDSSTTNAEVEVMRVEATSSGTPAVGFGPFIDFRGDRINGGPDSYGRLGFEADSMPSTTVDGAFIVQTAEDGTYSERMRISSDGKVGIGTNTPAAPLDVKFVDNTNAQRWSYGSSEDNFYLELDTVIPAGGVVSYNFNTKNNGTSYDNNLVLDRGKVGIGTGTPSQKLEVNGGIKFNAFSAGHGLNVVSNQTFNNSNVSNSIVSLNYKCFIINIYHNNGHSQVFGIANGGGGVGFDFTIIRPDTATAVHGRPIDFSFTTIGSSPNTFRVQISSGGGALTISRSSGSGSFSVQVHVIAGG